MELLQLKYFQHVAKHQNITKAANELHISQPSLSLTIKKLEEEIGIPLFRRVGKKIELNQYGEAYLKHVSRILTDLESAKDEVLELYGIKNTHISLSVNATLFLTELLRDFLIEHPNIKMTQSINTQDIIIESLKNGKIDFAITSPIIEIPEIETIELIEEEIVVIAPAKGKFGNIDYVYLKELSEENFIELTESYAFRLITQQLYNQAGFEPNIVFEGDNNMIEQLLRLDRGVALAPISIRHRYRKDHAPELEEFKILRLKDKCNKRKIGLSYLKGKYLSDLSVQFKQFTINYYNEFKKNLDLFE